MRNFSITTAEKVFTVLCMLLYTGGILTLILSGGYSQGEGQAVEPPDYSIVRLLFLVTYVVFGVLLTLRYKRVLYFLQQEFHIPLLIGLAFASCLWSGDPAQTFRNSVALLGTSMFGLYLATRYSMREQLQLLGISFGLITLLSFAFAIALPKYGIMGGTHAGTWRGIYTHKNTLGRVMVAGVITFLILGAGVRGRNLLYGLGLGCSFLLIILSTSKTALVTAIAFLIAAFAYRLLRLKDSVLAPALLSGILTGGLLITFIALNIKSFLASIGRDLTFSGRTELWSYSLQFAQRKLWLGHGYFYFWEDTDSADFIRRVTNFAAPHSHNGAIELLLDLGLIGLAIFLVGFAINLAKSIAVVRITQTPEGFWPLFLMTYFVSVNLTEANLLRPNVVYWALYVSVVYTLQAPNWIEQFEEGDRQVGSLDLSKRAASSL